MLRDFAESQRWSGKCFDRYALPLCRAQRSCTQDFCATYAGVSTANEVKELN